MPMSIIAKVFNFLWVTVWGKINILQFLTLNKHYLILAGSNIVLSLLFIYMAEQVTVRTDQYRELLTQIETRDNRVIELESEVKFLDKRNRNLIESFGLSTVKLDTATMLSEYDKWAQEIKTLEVDLQNVSKPLGDSNGRPTQTNPNSNN